MLLVLRLASVPTYAGPTPLYRVVDLGVGRGLAINNGGQAAGYAGDRAVLYSGGSMIDLGTLGGHSSYGVGIDDSGQVVGYSQLADATLRAFLYSGGVMTDLLGPLSGSESIAFDINSSGLVAGLNNTPGEPRSRARVFVYSISAGTMTYLGPTGSGVDVAINNSGQVVSGASVGATTHAVLWDSGGGMTDLGSLGDDSVAYDINDRGQVVGFSSLTATDWDYHAFLYSDGVMTDLGTFGGIYSHALGINNGGQVVGFASTADERERAFVYSAGTMTDLNTVLDDSGTGWTIEKAWGINDKGQIVADARNALGESRVVRLDPITEPPSPVSVTVDIKPGTSPNSINLCSRGVVTVAVLGSADFDVSTIDLHATLTFASATPRTIGKPGRRTCSHQDVSGSFSVPGGMPDGYMDLVCQFDTRDLDILTGSSSATVKGLLLDGRAFEGSDTINVVRDGCVSK